MIAAGGSGGHIFPALSLASALKEKQPLCEILFVGTKNIGSFLREKKYDFRIENISLDTGLPDILSLKMFVFLVKFIRSFFESLAIINRFRPDAVVAFGAYASVPVVICARIKNIKVILHEQNVVPGRANRLLKNFADRIAISFEKTSEYFDKDKVILTGNPVRADLTANIDKYSARRQFGLEPDKFTILIMGGSQGAHALNLISLEAFEKINSLKKGRIQVIHLTGESDCREVAEGYSRLNIKNKTFAFFNDMTTAFSASDLVISRAGATTITEICVLGKPAILIPYPYAYSHQTENAKALADRDAAVLIEQRDLNEDILMIEIGNLIDNETRLGQLISNCARLSRPDAAGNLANVVLEGLRTK